MHQRTYNSVLVLAALSTLCCKPPCLRGHDEKFWIPPYVSMEPMTIGDVTIYINQYNEGYWITKFVCDQYELEKMPK